MSNRTIQARVTAEFIVEFDDNGYDTLFDQANDAAIDVLMNAEDYNSIDVNKDFIELAPKSEWTKTCVSCAHVYTKEETLLKRVAEGHEKHVCPNCETSSYYLDKGETYVTE